VWVVEVSWELQERSLALTAEVEVWPGEERRREWCTELERRVVLSEVPEERYRRTSGTRTCREQIFPAETRARLHQPKREVCSPREVSRSPLRRV
jgi:hypothetical protein